MWEEEKERSELLSPSELSRPWPCPIEGRAGLVPGHPPTREESRFDDSTLPSRVRGIPIGLKCPPFLLPENRPFPNITLWRELIIQQHSDSVVKVLYFVSVVCGLGPLNKVCWLSDVSLAAHHQIHRSFFHYILPKHHPIKKKILHVNTYTLYTHILFVQINDSYILYVRIVYKYYKIM